MLRVVPYGDLDLQIRPLLLILFSDALIKDVRATIITVKTLLLLGRTKLDLNS